MQPGESRTGAMCAIVGSVLLFVGTYLHPLEADPNEAVAAFTEYATDRLWVTSHLTQLMGIVMTVAALLFLAHQLESASSRGWSRLAAESGKRRVLARLGRVGEMGAITSLVLAAALQAVDGIALKTMVDTWAAATASQKEVAFYAAFAVRQVEIGLASMASLLFGLTVIVYGIALLIDHTYPKWVGGLAVMGGVLTTVAGVVMAYTGFSGLAMAISMPAGSLLLAWMLSLGVFMWRRGGVPSIGTTI